MNDDPLSALVEDARMELQALFEHGFDQGAAFAAPLEALAGRLGDAGLGLMAEAFARLAGAARASRLEPPVDMTPTFALAWEGLALAADRLDGDAARAALDLPSHATEDGP